MTGRWVDHFAVGIHSARPSASAVPKGAFYSCTTHGLIYQSDGASTWSTWATLGSSGSLTAVTEVTTPSSPGAGTQTLFLDSSDHKLKRVNSSGTVTTVEGGSIPAWSSFTPTWAAASGTPAVGSTGSLTGEYQQLDKTVHFRINLAFGGSGISGGTGSWNFSLPVGHATVPSGIAQHGILLGGYFEDLGAVAYGVLGGRLKASSTTAFEVFYASHSASFPGSSTVMGATAPFTWGTGDYLSVYGTYKAA